MKTVTVQVAKEQFTRLVAEAEEGDVIVLTDGERSMALEASPEAGDPDLDLEKDSPELADELLKAAQGPFTSYSRQDLENVAGQVLRESSRE